MLVDKKRNGDLGPSIVVLSKNDSTYGYIIGYVTRNGSDFYDIRSAALIKSNEVSDLSEISPSVVSGLSLTQSIEVHVRNVLCVSLMVGSLKTAFNNRVNLNE